MPILDDYKNESMYEQEAWFISEVLHVEPDEKRILARLDTTSIGMLVQQQRVWPGHPKHFPGAVAVQMTATLGQLYAIYILGLRATEGWVGFGTHIKSARFGALGEIGPEILAQVTCTRARQIRGTWFTDFTFEYTQNGKSVYRSEQTAAWVQSPDAGQSDENRA